MHIYTHTYAGVLMHVCHGVCATIKAQMPAVLRGPGGGGGGFVIGIAAGHAAPRNDHRNWRSINYFKIGVSSHSKR